MEMTLSTRFCPHCNKERPVEDFYPSQTKDPRNHRRLCITHSKAITARCNKRKRAELKASGKMVAIDRLNNLKSSWGLTQEDYDNMLENQGGVCAICLGPPDREHYCVDHNHETGEIRGLLCNACNRGLGFLRDNTDIVTRAARYLKGANFQRVPSTYL